MKTTFWILFILVILVFLSKPSVTFKPFSIEFASPYLPFGIIFLMCSLICFTLQTRKDTKKEVFEDYYIEGFDYAVKLINQKLKEQGKDAQISVKHDKQ